MIGVGIGAGFLESLMVDPAVLNATAGKAYQEINTMEADFAELENLVMKTQAYWTGTGGDAFRTCYASEKDTVEQAIKNLKSDMENLYTISAQYTQTEKSLTDFAVSLPGDVIS